MSIGIQYAIKFWEESSSSLCPTAKPVLTNEGRNFTYGLRKSSGGGERLPGSGPLKQVTSEGEVRHPRKPLMCAILGT